MRVAVAARSADQVEETAQEIDGLAVTADVSKQEDVEAMMATVERELGPIDLLVNNAGIGLGGPLPWEEDPADWWHVFEINVLGAYLCSRAVLPGMVERGRGRIVNTGSGASYLPTAGATAYGASKAALGRFGELLAGQVAEHGIAVFVISPGPRPHRDDGALRRRRYRGRRPSWRRGSSASSRAGAPTGSPAATSTPSTTTSRR